MPAATRYRQSTETRAVAPAPGHRSNGRAAWLLLSAALLAGVAGGARAGAWTQTRGKFYDRVAVKRYAAERAFDVSGDKARMSSNGDFLDWNISNYAELGLVDRLTAVTSFSYKQIRARDDRQVRKAWGIGDIDTALRLRLVKGRVGVLSAQTLVKFPQGYDRKADLPLGNGQIDTELRLLGGCSLWTLFPGYGGVEVGWRWRAREPADELRYLVEMGSDLGRHLYARVKLDGMHGDRNGDSRDLNGNPTAANNYDLTRLDLTLGCRLARTRFLEVEWMPEIAGRSTAAGSTISAAFAITGR